MIDAHVWTTPNGFKALIALEEMGLPYKPHWVDITKGAQLTPEYLAINPNHKIPAIVDHDGPGGAPVTVFESGAILTYLAEKTGRFLARDGADRYTALEWVFFNIGNTGPMLGQLGFFAKFAPEKIQLAIDRYKKEAESLFGVLDGRLAQVPYLAGAEYTIADMINVTWPRAAKSLMNMSFERWPHLDTWIASVEQRPAVAKALAMKP